MKPLKGVPPSQWQKVGLTVGPERYPDHTARMFSVSHQMLVKTAISNYLSHLRRRKLSQNYIKQSRYILNALKKTYGDYLTRDLTRKDVGIVLKTLYNRVAPNTFSHYSRVFYLFFEFCRAQKYLLYNYVREFDLKYHRTKMFFDTHQLDLIFKALEPGEIRDACLVIYHTGIQRTELDRIVGPDFINGTLVLSDRRVACPKHILTVIERRRLFDSARVEVAFTEFMKQFDFDGNLRFLQNSYVLRCHYVNTPLPVIRNQIGFSEDRHVEEKIERLKSGAQSLYDFVKRTPFKDYY